MRINVIIVWMISLQNMAAQVRNYIYRYMFGYICVYIKYGTTSFWLHMFSLTVFLVSCLLIHCISPNTIHTWACLLLQLSSLFQNFKCQPAAFSHKIRIAYKIFALYWPVTGQDLAILAGLNQHRKCDVRTLVILITDYNLEGFSWIIRTIVLINRFRPCRYPSLRIL